MLNKEEIFNQINNTLNLEEARMETEKLYTDSIPLIEEILELIIKRITKKDNNLSLDNGVIAVSNVLIHLSRLMYEDEETFKEARENAKLLVENDLIYTLDQPTPCGMCECCKNGDKYGCENISINVENTQIEMIPLIASELINHIYWSNIYYGKIKQTYAKMMLKLQEELSNE
jgi:hypothetical protein